VLEQLLMNAICELSRSSVRNSTFLKPTQARGLDPAGRSARRLWARSIKSRNLGFQSAFAAALSGAPEAIERQWIRLPSSKTQRRQNEPARCGACKVKLTFRECQHLTGTISPATPPG